MKHLRPFLVVPLLGFWLATAFAAEAPVLNSNEVLLRDTFYLTHTTKLEREVFDVEGFTLVQHAAPDWNSSFSVVTGFRGNVLTTHILKDINSVDDARKFFQKSVKPHDVNGVNVRELSLLRKDGSASKMFWVGNRAFRSLEDAKKSVKVVKKTIEDRGGSFETAIQKVRESAQEPLPPKKAAPPLRAELEEEFAMKALDWLGFNQYLYGPLWGEPSGEKILYQSTFEGSYRTTNFDERHFDAAAAFWSHRVVFRGLRGPAGTTFDPYIEAVPVVQTEGRDFATLLEVSAGVEWRPFIRTAIIQNYQPFGLPLLDWIANTRFYIAYSQRKNIKERFEDAVKTHNLRAGVGLFKEWGIDLPSFDQISGESPYFKRGDLFWGELFAESFFNQTNFSSQDNYDSIHSTLAFKIGVKLPRVPLPDNPVNQEFMVMPYFTFEDNRNFEQSLFYQNRYAYGWGVRWMPFRDYRFANNEWLFKTKFFFEYLQDLHYTKAKPLADLPEQDIRLGVNVSLKRF